MTDTAEFASDEQREAYIAALETEAKHVEQISKAEHLTDAQRAAEKRRAGEVEAELKRLRGGVETRLRGEGAETR